MKLLLDTSTLLWATLEPASLSSVAASALLDPQNDRYVSLVSAWEIQIKQSLGKLNVEGVVHEQFLAWIESISAVSLEIELRHIGHLYKLANHHGDPFDRLLIAQATCEGMHIVSPDKMFRRYDVPVIW